jgi:GNAT superfamily N-acetyltransferase
MSPVTVLTAYGDAQQAEGRLWEGRGGGTLELPGIRLMASGLPHPQWNSGDAERPDIDLAPVRGFYADLGVPWGVRVPVGLPWRHGRHVLRRRCMGLIPGDLRAAPPAAGVTLRVAGPADLDAVAAINATAFESDTDVEGAWIAPQLGAAGFRILLAERGGEPVGAATGVYTDGRAGPAIGVFGVGVLPGARRHGIGAALTTAVVRWGFDSGARLGHLTADTEGAARVYGRLGFRETPGFDVYVSE